jgi:anti-sigma factor (TIGR02949 family)
MKTMAYPDQACERVLDLLDPYMDRELGTAETDEVSQHLSTCEACKRELDARTSSRERLRSAVRSISASPELRDRITRTIRSTPAAQRLPMYWTMSIAAAVTLAMLGGVVAYELGHLRMTTVSQDSYIATISRRVGDVMSVGLRDHVHCAVFRKYPTKGPSPEQIARDMGQDYAGLVNVVREHVPAEQQIVMAHRCGYRGRKFIHLALADGKHLASLVIALRQPGENFNSSSLTPVLSDGGLPIYGSSVHRFQIDGFETSSYLVYLVSDLPGKENLEMFARLAPSVRGYLAKLES